MAISLAMICKYLGMRFISVIDPRTTETNLQILKALDAKIDYVANPDPVTGEFLPARLNRVQQLLTEIPGTYWPNQYANANNYLAHYHTTMKEIVTELERVDYLFCSVSTCGTIRGLAEYVRDHGLRTKIVAVDAEGSAIFGGNKSTRRFPGLGAGIVPPFCRTDLIDRIVHVSDSDIVKCCRMLAKEESILAGASSGGIIAAVKQMEPDLTPGAVCAVILHDKESATSILYTQTHGFRASSDGRFGLKAAITLSCNNKESISQGGDGMLYLNDRDIQSVGVDWPALVESIETAVGIIDSGDYVQPVKPYLRYKNPQNRIIAMPAYVGER